MLVLRADGGTQWVAGNLVATGLIDTATVAGVPIHLQHGHALRDAILVYTNTAPINGAHLGDFLQAYVDTTSGGVLIGNYAFNENFALAGGIMEDGYPALYVGPGTGSGPGVGSQMVPTSAGLVTQSSLALSSPRRQARSSATTT